MKNKFILFLFFLSLVIMADAQTLECTPDTTILKTINVIHPSPYRDTVPGSGIQQKACIGEPFALPFTILVPNVFVFGGVSLPLISATLPTVGAVSGLPDGLSYTCNPPNCVMLANTPGCIQLSGTPTTQNDTGAYKLTIKFTISTGIGPLAAEFPGSLFPGEYILRLNAPGQCENTTAIKIPEAQWQVTTSPNPFHQQTSLNFWNERSKTAVIRIFNVTGAKVREIKSPLLNGVNNITLHREGLPAGLYYITMTAGRHRHAQRILIQD